MPDRDLIIFFKKPLLTIVSIACLSLFLTYSCKKKEDAISPVIDFIVPDENTTFKPGDTLDISFSVSDEKTITHVSVALVDNQNQTYFSDEVYIDQYIPFEQKVFNFSLVLSNINPETGPYFIEVKASDNENTAVSKRGLNVIGIGKTTNGYLLVSGDSLQYNVTLRNLEFNTNKSFEHSGTFLDAFINRHEQHLVVCGSQTGDLLSYNIRNENLIWNLPNAAAGLPQGYFNSVYYDDKDQTIYVSTNKAEVISYSTSGSLRGGFLLQNDELRAEAMMAEGQQFFFQTRTLNSQYQKLVRTVKGGNWAVNSVHNMSDKIIFSDYASPPFLLAFVKTSQNNSVKKINMNEDSGEQDILTELPTGDFKSVVKVPEQGYLLLYTDGVYFFNTTSNIITAIESSNHLTALTYDDVNQHVIIGDLYGKIRVKSLNGGNLQTYETGQKVLKIVPWYSE